MSDNYNWRRYRLLMSGEFYPEDLVIELSSQPVKKNPVTKKAVEAAWQEAVKGSKSVGREVWDSVSYRLIDFSESGRRLKLRLGETTYKDLQGTNAANWILGDVYGKDYLANGLLVQALVLTREGKVVLGKRATGVKREFEPYAIFGGTADKEEGEIKSADDLFAKILLELNEEVGIDREDLAKIYLGYLIEDWKYYPVFIFCVFLKLSSDEVKKRFASAAHDEHSALVFLEKEELAEKIKSQPERFTDLTLAAVDLYLQGK